MNYHNDNKNIKNSIKQLGSLKSLCYVTLIAQMRICYYTRTEFFSLSEHYMALQISGQLTADSIYKFILVNEDLCCPVYLYIRRLEHWSLRNEFNNQSFQILDYIMYFVFHSIMITLKF